MTFLISQSCTLSPSLFLPLSLFPLFLLCTDTHTHTHAQTHTHTHTHIHSSLEFSLLDLSLWRPLITFQRWVCGLILISVIFLSTHLIPSRFLPLSLSPSLSLSLLLCASLPAPSLSLPFSFFLSIFLSPFLSLPPIPHSISFLALTFGVTSYLIF